MTNANDAAQDVVLFIDDEKICHIVAELIIHNYTKYKLISAFSGKQALGLLEKYADNIVLIISDIMLPDVNGYKICKAAAKNKKLANVPFIFQSGLLNQEKEVKKQTKKNFEILYKPYKQEALLEAIKKTMAI